MIDQKTISEKLLFTTVRISVEKNKGSYGTRTGFFFDYMIDDQRIMPMVITNKHVIAESKNGNFYLHETEGTDDDFRPTGKFHPVALDNFENRWISHQRADIDLCGMLINPIFEEFQKKTGKGVYRQSLNIDLIRSDEELMKSFDAVEDVLMVGYPIGLFDEHNNLPLIRRGITATHPGIDFNGRSITMIDAACFPGSSGSPVLIVDEGAFLDKKGSGNIVRGSRVVFLGVLSSGPVHTAEGKIVIRQVPTSTQISTETGQMIHLGQIIKAKAVLELCKQIRTDMESRGVL